jgi:thiol-disulfide isomerase/thioredoxin
MLSSIQSLFGKKNNVATPVSESKVSVRSPDDIDSLEKMIKIGPVTFVLVHADWCGPCQNYKPIWSELEKAPGRNANMAMVHHDMVESSPTLKKAKIPGYPSVLKVHSNGSIEEYKEESKKTNAMPNIRDKEVMIKELSSPKNSNSTLNLDKMVRVLPGTTRKLNIANVTKLPSQRQSNLAPGLLPRAESPYSVQVPRQATLTYNKLNNPRTTTPMQVSRRLNRNRVKSYPASELTRRNLTNAAVKVSNKLKPSTNETLSIGASVPPMKGGLYKALSHALMRAGPACTLFAASQMLPNKKVRGSTLRRTRKANSRSSKN